MRKINTNLSRFKLLSEYTFIEDSADDDSINGYLLIDDDMNEADDIEMGDDMPMDDEGTPDGGEEMPDDGNETMPDDGGTEELPTAEPLLGDEPEIEPEEDSVELDMTELVNGIKQTNTVAMKAAQSVADLSNKIDSLINNLGVMNTISGRIENLEKEIIKRNPTEVEKLSMRSLDSYPYNVKLTDFWGDQNKEGGGSYVKTDGSENNIPRSNEYILTQDDVDTDYNEHAIKKTFDYEEEDI